MGLFDNWPYSDVHQLNLDWILKVIKEIKGKTDEIDGAVETAQQAAEDASQSEIDAAAAKDDAILAAGNAQNFYNQILYLTGSAVVANTAADMTDTTKVYIYTGTEAGYETGHWYYYDGNDWVDGGLYGASSSMTDNAINILEYILNHVAYTDPDMQNYVDALCDALRGHELLTTFTITNVLAHITTSNVASGINYGESYVAVLTPESDYNISTVTVTMGGVDVTSTVYSAGTITIASVTGNIVITATAEANPLPSGYTAHDYINATSRVSLSASQMIELATYPNLNRISLEMKVKVTAVKSGYAILGGRTTNGATDSFAFYAGNNPNTGSLGYHLHGSDTGTVIPLAINTLHTVKYTATTATPSILTVDNTNTYNIAWVNDNTINSPIRLLSNPVGAGSQYTSDDVQIGEIIIRDTNGDVINHYYPCVRDLDNVIGMYDSIGSSFYTASEVAYVTIGNASCKFAVGDWS